MVGFRVRVMLLHMILVCPVVFVSLLMSRLVTLFAAFLATCVLYK